MSKARAGDTVKVHYTGKLDDGAVFDSSQGSEPLQFTLGDKQVIEGFDSAVEGMEVGDTKEIEIPSHKAYGKQSDDLITEVEKDKLPDDLQPELGMKLQVSDPSGNTFVALITQITDSHITIDANHPLVGRDLTFELELLEIV